ncbi:MAG: hypothetical protein CM1200mP29_04280 [Verrucomicrobiota bacterium]|nr:MAG: hypothetical protein CM1200mP29_04280 [Verrucomicrobiota bacterium]
MMKVFGAGPGTNSLGDIDVTDLLLASGCNPIMATGYRLSHYASRKRGMKLIVADPITRSLRKWQTSTCNSSRHQCCPVPGHGAHNSSRWLEASSEWMETRTENLEPYKEMMRR